VNTSLNNKHLGFNLVINILFVLRGLNVFFSGRPLGESVSYYILLTKYMPYIKSKALDLSESLVHYYT